MANIQLSCVIRKGLNMPEGLLAAQVAHISDQWMRDKILSGKTFSKEEQEWMKTPYIAILAVDTLEELQYVYDDGVKNNLNPVMWKDIIYSNILKRPMPDIFVGLSLGPSDSDKIKAVTGNLKLY